MPRLRLTRALGALAFALPLAFTGCAAPTGTTTADGPRQAVGARATPACPPSPFSPSGNVATNYTVGFENYRRGDFCLALPYLRWVAANDPLYTGAEPGDRNFARLADTYEQIAAMVDSGDTALRRAYLDSALAVRTQRDAALAAASLPVDAVQSKLDASRFYLTYDDDYTDGRARAWQLAMEAFDDDPTALTDFQLNYVAQHAAAHTEADTVMHVLNALRQQANDPAYITALMQTARRSPSMPAFVAAVAPREEQFAALEGIYRAGVRSQDVVRPLAVAAYELGRTDVLDEVAPLLAADSMDTAIYHRALAARSARAGNTAEAMQHFQHAYERAESAAERRDLHYQQALLAARSGQAQEAYRLAGEALNMDATHGPSLLLRADLVARSVPTTGTPQERAAAWCAADVFQRVAQTGDPAVTAMARREAFRYNRAGPAPTEYAAAGWRAGQSVTTNHAFGSCTTAVR
jgi:tetratricopeptide (TPR) repeat protein